MLNGKVSRKYFTAAHVARKAAPLVSKYGPWGAVDAALDALGFDEMGERTELAPLAMACLAMSEIDGPEFSCTREV